MYNVAIQEKQDKRLTVDTVTTTSLSKIRKREQREDLLRMKKLKHKKFLREQILNYDRIDLLMTEILGYEVKDFHLLMWYHRKNKYLDFEGQRWHLALAPRGTGKSTILTIASIILDVLKNPNIRILIASKTDKNAVGFLSEIKQKLASKKIVDIFGEQVGTLWNESEITVKARTSTAKEPTVMCIGVSGALASKHFDKIYADDLVDEENSKTETQRDKLKTWFYKLLDPTLEPSGEMSLIGTRYHPDDIYGYFIDNLFEKKDKKGKVKKRWYIRIPALMKKEKYPAKSKPWERYISIWPEKFSVKFLLKKRRSQGRIIFNSQMQNDVEAMKGKIFKVDWFQFYTSDEIDLSKLIIFQGVDLAIKQKDNADKFAHCTIGIDQKTRNIYILNYYNRVTHYKNQKAIIKDRHSRYQPVRVAIEGNGYQRAIIQDMKSDSKLSHVRAIPIFTEDDKALRAWKLSAYFERGQVFMLETMHELQEILLKMPDSRYKDLFDALDFAITCAFSSGRKKREKEPGLI